MDSDSPNDENNGYSERLSALLYWLSAKLRVIIKDSIFTIAGRNKP